MTDLHLEIDPSLGRRTGLEEALRQAIRSGALVAGARLPSTRALAVDLGIARSTVVEAYEQLTAEGFLDARHGSATRVAAMALPTVGAADGATHGERAPRITDFLPGEPDLGSFPRAAWTSTARAVLRDAPASTFAYGDAFGLRELRETLAAYLGRARAVVASPERVAVFSGFGDALATVLPMLTRVGVSDVGTEDPCLPWHRDAVGRMSTVHPVSVDDEGVVVSDLAATPARAVLTTPAHQYPLGVTMSAARRAELVAWARDTDGWVIEDDYDGEFRYDRQPVGALQGVAPDRVLYAGTASKSIVPGIGIGWLVVPPALIAPLRELLHQRLTTSTIEQAVLSRFVDAGQLDRHLRRMRLVYRRRRRELLDVLDSAPELTVRGIAAGLHVTAHVESAEVERELLARAAAAGIALFPLSVHYGVARREHGVVLGFTRAPEHAWAAALRRLRALLARR